MEMAGTHSWRLLTRTQAIVLKMKISFVSQVRINYIYLLYSYHKGTN
jgi:hypothetical protein